MLELDRGMLHGRACCIRSDATEQKKRSGKQIFISASNREKLKRDLATRHIPVQGISTEEEDARALRLGARSVLRKPVKTRAELERTVAELAAYVAGTRRTVLLGARDR